MAFPTTGLPATVEISPGADLSDSSAGWVWTDITSSVRLEDGIHITQGRGDGAGRVDPSTCRLRLDNRAGDFTPRNPLGAYYGSLGRNTPLRVSIRRAEDTFTRSESNGWGTEPLWGGTWTVTGGSASDYSVSGGTGRQSLGTTGTLRQSFVDVGGPDVRVTVDVTCPVVPTGATITHWVAARAADTSNYYVALLEIGTAGGVDLRLRSRVGGTLSANLDSASVGTHSAGNTWRVVVDVVGSKLRAKAWKTSGSEPTAWQVEVTDTDLTAGTQVGMLSGRTGGNTNGTVVIQWDNLTVDVDRFSGFVSSWPPRWDKSGRDATVPIEANGILRRLGQGTPPAKSPLRRTIGASGPVAYWPVEDGAASNQVGSAIPGHPAMTVTGTVDFRPIADFSLTAGDAGIRWGTSALADLSAGGSLSATVPSGGPPWTVQVFAGVDDTTLSGDIVIAEWDTPGGTFVRWRMQVTTGTHTQVIAFNSAGTPTTIVDQPSATTGSAIYSVSAAQNGGNIDVTLRRRGLIDDTGSPAGTLTAVTSIRCNPTGVTSSVQTPFGHVAVFAADDLPYNAQGEDTDAFGQPVGFAVTSWWNETAADRLARLCDEEGVSVSIPAVSEEFSTRMGWQPAGTFLDLLYECADADQGVLYESGFGLGYLPREHRYNRAVDLALDFAQGQIAEPPEPTDDDYNLVNRVKLSRVDGSSVVVEDADSIAAVGLYETEVTVNHADDTRLADHAALRAHLGAVDEMRWPRIDINLAAAPELIDDWLACGIQSRVTAVNPPDEVAGDDIDVIGEGYSETLGFKDWDVEANCSPAKPWDIATVDGDPRVAADGSTLAASLTSTATSFSLASTTANGVWTTVAADFPLDVNVGGERITLSAISGTTSPQTATVSARSVNGIVKAHAAGTSVDVWEPAIVAL